MNMKFWVLAALIFSGNVFAQTNHLEELDPFAPDINEQLEINEGSDSFNVVMSRLLELTAVDGKDCFRDTCEVFVEVDRTRQRAIIRLNGEYLMDQSGVVSDEELLATTGSLPSEKDPKDRRTPLFDRHPQAPLRIYDVYNSSAYPGGGDWNGFGNMPFAVFIKGGFAIHGTTGDLKWGSISKLGTIPLSHGCIRIHPLNAQVLNQAVRKAGARKTWIWVHD